MNKRWIHGGARVRVAAGVLAALAGFPALAADPTNTIFHDRFEDTGEARFLTQSTFGPTDADIGKLRGMTYDAWLDDQFAQPATRETDYMNWATGHNAGELGEQEGQTQRIEAWFLGALGGPDPKNNLVIHRDQLRQRVAFALSEILVVSQQNALLAASPRTLAYYYDILVDNAFGNYGTILRKVTLSPTMGIYLNMVGNQRADEAANIHPDENYAREIMQLFTVGLVKLNLDGSPILVGGVPDPTYVQDQVMNLAHVFTGWTYADCTGYTFDCGPDQDGIEANLLVPMIPYKDPDTGAYTYHDNGRGPDDTFSKQLLIYPGAANGGILAAAAGSNPDVNHDPTLDLDFALANLYNHPNVAPFISRQLIQRLVTSNPSPAYIARVAQVFHDNLNAANQLQLVVRAILLDPEARAAPSGSFGKLREPLLALTHFWRAMDARHQCGHGTLLNSYRYAGYVSTWGVDDVQYGSGVAQSPLSSPSVFNFFKPSFIPPGEPTTLHLYAPEFQLQTESILANTVNHWRMRAFSLDYTDSCDAGDDEGNVVVNHGKDLALAGHGNGGPGDPADRLVDAYNARFMAGQMSASMRGILLGYLNQIDSSWTDNVSDWRYWRVYTALYLIFTSPEYMIQK
jgi:uncharacterized protein (DUF1800 family)